MNARFLECARAENPCVDEISRVKQMSEFHIPLEAGDRICQASRCLSCGVPFCQSDFGCPLHNLIPEWNELLSRGFVRQAYERLVKTASFPEFTGRVCPALCEKACNLADDGATTNRDNELYIIETAFANGWVEPRIPNRRTGKRVGVVGSGPSGLAAAQALNHMGHFVTVYERDDAPGGLLMYGIPFMKLDKRVIERRVDLMRREGVEFVLNANVDASIEREFDAVALCCGARQARGLNVPGAVYAVDFLTQATRAHMQNRPSDISAQGKNVVVVGGGDTGNDCVATCLRQNCASVAQIEILPKPPERRAPGNPWPEWPRIEKTDYGQQEAIAIQGGDPRIYQTTVKAFDGERALIVSLKWGERGFSEVENSERYIPCDMLITAAGFTGCEEATCEAFGATRDNRGNLPSRAGEKLFSAGDMHTGQSLVVRAIADARRAAGEIHAFLMG